MSAADTHRQDAWQETFFPAQDRTAPGPDDRPGWQLTALGIVIGVLGLLMLSV